MNTTSDHPPAELPASSTVTRRSFIKRTATTAVVTVLALHAFRTEVQAADAGGSSSGNYEIEMTGTPASIVFGQAPQITLLDPSPNVTSNGGTFTISAPAFASGNMPFTINNCVLGLFPAYPSFTYLINLKQTCMSSIFSQTQCSDGVYRYSYSSEVVQYDVDMSILSGTSSVWGSADTSTVSFSVQALYLGT